MKISRRFTAVLGAVAAIALPVASQAQVTYYTTGVFGSTSSNVVTSGGMTITYNALGTPISPFSVGTPSFVNFGNFVTSGTGAGTFNDSFTLNIFQSVPSMGSNYFLGSVTGTLTPGVFGTSTAVWTPSITSFNIGAATYVLTKPLYPLILPDKPDGKTTIEGYVSTPEPSSMALLGTGLIGLVPMFRRKKQS